MEKVANLYDYILWDYHDPVRCAMWRDANPDTHYLLWLEAVYGPDIALEKFQEYMQGDKDKIRHDFNTKIIIALDNIDKPTRGTFAEFLEYQGHTISDDEKQKIKGVFDRDSYPIS